MEFVADVDAAFNAAGGRNSLESDFGKEAVFCAMDLGEFIIFDFSAKRDKGAGP